MNFISLFSFIVATIMLAVLNSFSQQPALMEIYKTLQGEEKIPVGLAIVEKLTDQPEEFNARSIQFIKTISPSVLICFGNNQNRQHR